MSHHDSVLEHIYAAKLVAIMRGDYRGRWMDYANALHRGGVSIFEITLNSPGALDAITELRAALAGQMRIGAGTVLSADAARAAIDAGAEFIVAPDTDKTVIEVCKSRDIVVMPGAYTPTEVKQAYLMGADVVKLFPATTPDYVGAVHAPLNHIPLMATGGVGVETAAEFLKKGAKALGIGTFLTSTSISLDEVTVRAVKLTAAIGLTP